MKSRIAVTLILALGLLMTTTGAAVGIDSLSRSAAQVQYGVDTPPNPVPDQNQGGSAPDGEESPQPGGSPQAGEAPEGEASPEGQASPEAIGQPEAAAEGPTQAPAQVATSGTADQLPFTGFVAIPVLIAGLALLATGIGLRRSTRRGTEE